MSIAMTRRSGFVMRMLSLCAFICMLLFSAIVFLQNEEIGKLIPPSSTRTLALLFGYLVALFSFNYALAIRGRNFMGWQTELYISVGFAIIFIAFFLPHAFPTSEVVLVESWIPFYSKEELAPKANWQYAWLILLSLPALYFARRRIKSMPLWQQMD